MSASTKTDEDLMLSFQNGEKAAFSDLYQRHKTPIFSFLARQYVTPDNASELTQEVFLRAVQSASSFKHGSKFTTWIYAIARNSAIDFLRRHKHRKHESLDKKLGPDGPPLTDMVAGNKPTPDRESMANRLRRDLERAIKALPAEQREVFLLREYHGLRFDEISEVVNAKTGTVKSRMRYALEALRRELSEYHEYARTLI